jgi:SAM-dependent methyltransferase
MLRLNLGCSNDHRQGFVNVDIAQPADELVDLARPWPWPDDSVEHILAFDVLEHLPSKIVALNEAYRVLEPGGLLELAVPCVMLADGRVNPGAFADPTHQTYWTMDDRYYFCEEWNNPEGERGRLGPAYGITALFRPKRWELVEYGKPAERRSKIFGLLEAVKGGRVVSPVGIGSGERFGKV